MKAKALRTFKSFPIPVRELSLLLLLFLLLLHLGGSVSMGASSVVRSSLPAAVASRAL